jgi:hypothetical protein
MKKLLSLCLILVFMAGCTATFTQVMYREQATSLSSYKVINNTLTDMRANGLVSDEGWKQYSTYANRFLDAHRDVSKAMAEYKRGQTPQSAVELAQKFMLMALEELKKYYFKTVPADQQKPLF